MKAFALPLVALASLSDEGHRGVSALRREMEPIQANGARLGWLLLPHFRAVEIWRAGQHGMAARIESARPLAGGALDGGLGLDLEEIWAV